jgi:hypothetical protein
MLTDFISVFIGIVGILLLSYGTYLISPEYGFITLGSSFTLFSFLLSRVNAINEFKNKKR